MQNSQTLKQPEEPEEVECSIKTGCYFGQSMRPASSGAAWLDLVACPKALINYLVPSFDSGMTEIKK